jgi:glycosyltransferase involved in cell wall biosynthesis
MRVKNEEEWLELAVRSLEGFADQIVIGDNGSRDGTPSIIRRLVSEFPGRVEGLEMPEADILGLTNALVRRAKYRWVVRWDGDFVAQTEGPHRVGLLREWLLGRPPWRFDFLYLRMVELAGDLWHQDPWHPVRSDAHLWTASEDLSYVYNPQGQEAPRVPLRYRVAVWEAPCLFHMHIKSDGRLFSNYLWTYYLMEPGKPATLQEYAERICATRYGGASFEDAARSWVNEYVRRLVPFDSAKHSDYPALVKPLLKSPRYRLKYENGRIAGRETLS